MPSKVSGFSGGMMKTKKSQTLATSSSAPAKTAATRATTVSPPQLDGGGKKSSSATAAAEGELFADDRRFQVDKKIVDELLLVCGVIGTTMDNGGIVPVTDCLNWLQDLQRALRRDDDAFRPISLLLGQWNVVVQKLLPLCLSSCRYDTPMLLTIVKILVILTKPLSENTVRAGKMVIDTKSKKATEAFIKEQIKLRDNALQQAEQLLEYKRAICHHPSHRNNNNSTSRRGRNNNNKAQTDGATSNSNNNNNGGGGGLLSIFVSLLAEPLGKSRRTDADHLTIELVLHLFRNLLAAEPLLHNSSSNSSTSAAKQLHHELIALLDQELVLEILLVLSADLEQRENAPYNLLVMEILQHLFRHEDPMAVARIGSSSSSSSLLVKSKPRGGGGGSGAAGTGAAATTGAQYKPSLLGQTMLREKQTLTVPTMSRHSNFGGTLVLQRSGGAHNVATDKQQQQYVSTAAFLAQRNEPLSAAAAAMGSGGGDHEVARRKNKRNEPFIGAKTSRLQHGRHCRDGTSATMGPPAQKAARVLHEFCRRFCQQAYGPVMKSLKNEFRRDSVRLEDGDRVVFFRLVWFFSQWWRVTTSSGKHALVVQAAEQSSDKKKPAASSSSTAIGQLIFTMDVFTFNLVLNATDTFMEHKKYGRLAQAVALLAEMMHLLFVLHNSPEPTETVMAMGLMDRLFYSSDPMDRLPKLLSKWEPGTGTREYACDLVEVCHMQLKLLESTRSKAAADKDITNVDKKKRKGKKKNAADDDDATPSDAVANMKAIAADFDVESYLRRLISNHNVMLYTQLLAQYAVNAPQVNHRIVAFFMRLSKFKIILPENDVDEQEEIMPAQNPLATKTVTLEPMLFNITMLTVLNTILNDVIIRTDKDYTTTLQFASNLMFHFSQAAAANPMLYVEALLKHATPARYCDSITNQYVTEELRMMVERDMLREDQQRQREEMDFEKGDDDDDNNDGDAAATVNNNSSNGNNKTNKNAKDDDDGDSDEEFELEDFGLISGSSKTKGNNKQRKKGKSKKRKVVLEDSDEDDDGSDDDADDAATKKASSKSSPSSTTAAAAKKKKGVKNQHLDDTSDDSDDDDDKATKKPPPNTTNSPSSGAAAAASAKNGSENRDLEDSDDSDDDKAAKKPPSNHSKKSHASVAAKKPSDEDFDDSDDESKETEIVKKTSGEWAKFLNSQDDSSSDDESLTPSSSSSGSAVKNTKKSKVKPSIKKSSTMTKATPNNKDDSDDSSGDDNGDAGKENPTAKQSMTSNKRKSLEEDSDDDDESLSNRGAKKKQSSGDSTTPPKRNKKARAKANDDDEDDSDLE